MKKLDFPPIWLLGFLVLTAVLWFLFPNIAFHFPRHDSVAFVMFAAGFGIVLIANRQMRQANTTVIPRHEPTALVTTGVFSVSRNPIYLGAMLILASAVMFWGSFLALVLLWVFYKVIEVRFIRGEEAILRSHFGDEYEQWAARTRRWL